MRHPTKVLGITSAAAALAGLGILVATTGASLGTSALPELAMSTGPSPIRGTVEPCLCPVCTGRFLDGPSASTVPHVGSAFASA